MRSEAFASLLIYFSREASVLCALADRMSALHIDDLMDHLGRIHNAVEFVLVLCESAVICGQNHCYQLVLSSEGAIGLPFQTTDVAGRLLL